MLSWGLNNWCNLGHHLEKDEIVFKPKIIDISNVKCISSTGGTTYFLKNDGLIYFCGVVVINDNNQNIYEKLAILLEREIKFESLYFVNKYKYKSRKSLASAIADGNIYELKINFITKTKYKMFDFTQNNIRETESKSYFDYISANYQMTHKTIELGFNDLTDKTLDVSQDIQTEESVFTRKHLKIFNKLDSGAFGQVFKVKHQLDQQFYAVKRINLLGIQIIKKSRITIFNYSK